MEQTNSLAMNMLQTITSQAASIPKTGKADSDEASDFQKLLDKKAQEKDPLVEEPAKTPAKEQTAAKKTEKVPAQKQGDAYEEAIKQGVVQIVGQVPVDVVLETVTLKNPETGEDIALAMGSWEPQIEVNDLAAEEPEMFTGEIEVPQVIDVSDPEADAILEATAPGADNSPAALLEEVVNEQIGEVTRQVMEEIQPQDTDDDTQVEVVDVEQAPQRVFHDVQAAPVKVGEAYSPEQTDEVDVVKQVENQIAQAVQNGQSTVTVKLTPENLGEVTVQVSVKSDGILAVAISARNDDTRALLDRHSANLQELLSARVRQTVEVDVQRGQENQQSQNHRNYDGHNGHAQDQQRERRQQREPASSQDFMQQLRLGLIPTDGEL